MCTSSGQMLATQTSKLCVGATSGTGMERNQSTMRPVLKWWDLAADASAANASCIVIETTGTEMTTEKPSLSTFTSESRRSSTEKRSAWEFTPTYLILLGRFVLNCLKRDTDEMNDVSRCGVKPVPMQKWQ